MITLSWEHASGKKDSQTCTNLRQAEQFIGEQVSAGMTFCGLEVCDDSNGDNYSLEISLRKGGS